MKSQIANPKAERSAKPYDLKQRTFEFAARILDLTAAIPGTPEGGVIRQQLARAGTSVGANVEEGDGAVSRADKRKAFIVARKECREARFWLRLIDRKWSPAMAVGGDIAEATELLYILSSIVDKLGMPKT